MSTHNICFHGEIRKILCGYPLLSVAMICAYELCLPIYQPMKYMYIPFHLILHLFLEAAR